MFADELTGTAQADRFRVAVLASDWSQILMLASALPDVSPLMNLIQRDTPGTAAVGLLAVVFGQQVMGYSDLLGFGQREPERRTLVVCIGHLHGARGNQKLHLDTP